MDYNVPKLRSKKDRHDPCQNPICLELQKLRKRKSEFHYDVETDKTLHQVKDGAKIVFS